MLFIQPSMLDSNARVQEADLLMPALLMLAKAKQAGMESGITCVQLADALESVSVLSPGDIRPAKSQRITHFRRQVYDMMLNGTLEKEGWVTRPRSPAPADPMQRLFSISSKGSAHLAKHALATLGVPNIPQEVADSERRTLEKDIKVPSLYLLACLEQLTQQPVPMTVLRTTLRSVLPKSRVDMETLKNRTDSRLDQVIRNLTSHNTLLKEGWSKRTAEGLRVTQSGYEVLADYVIRSLPTPPMFARPTTLKRALQSAPAASAEEPVAKPRTRRGP